MIEEKLKESVKVQVQRMGVGGEGVARSGQTQKVVFVPYAAPGDELEAELTEIQPRFSRARIKDVLKPGPGRVEPACPVHFRPGAQRWCGGCDWQHLSAEAQLEAKRSIVAECLERIGGLKLDLPPVHASPQPWRYRNKVQVPFLANPDGSFSAGFYHPGTHEPVPFEDCRVQPELSVKIFKFVVELAKRRQWPAYDEKKQKGWLKHLFIRTSQDGKAMLAFITKSDVFHEKEAVIKELCAAFPEIVGIHQNVQPLHTSVIFGRKWHKLWGKGRLREKFGKLTLAVSPASFLQVNTPAAEALYEHARAFLQEDGFKAELLFDLYGGIGSIALYLADLAPNVLGIESVHQAVEDAGMNAGINKIDNVRFVHGKAEFILPRLELDKPAPWAAIIDPPRTGCEKTVLDYVQRQEFKRLIYLSCDPSSFARDAKILTDQGWTLEKVQPVDLFPQTAHVELAAKFTR